MLNSSGRIINNGNIANNYKKTSINVNYNIQNEKSSTKKSSSELFVYLKTKEKNSISLYTHIQALLDMFIFQNPIQPVKYFEYYSVKLKENYLKPQPDPDLDFFNNIKLEISQKISDKYKDFIITNRGTHNVEENKSFPSYIDEIEMYEEEDIYHAAESNEIIVQDLTKINYMFNKAGCGLTNDEVNLIGGTMNQMSHQEKFKNIRYWGKILGLKHNYYILECEWKDEELEYKLKILNHIMGNKVLDNNENIYENENQEQEVELEDYYFNPKSIYESESIYSQNSNPLCPAPSTELGTDDYLSNEMFGFGANKKSYFVTNKLYEEWIELPLLKSHHVIQARNIKRYFVGELESRVDSYPLFQGLEKHYLRAQIARITAATQISPSNYFVLDTNHRSSTKWRKLNSFQSKVMSKKWVHNYAENQNYISPPVYALLEPINWVHHIPKILDQGVTKAWTQMFEEDKNEVKVGKISLGSIRTTIAKDSESLILGQDGFTALSDDVHAGLMPPWKCEMTNPFDHQATYVAIRSHLWPGAFAVTRQNILDYTYNGWGLKRNVIDHAPQILDEQKLKHLKDTEETTEIKDPTCAEEQSFFSYVRQMKGPKRYSKFNFKSFTMYEGDGEDEEQIINNYTFD